MKIKIGNKEIIHADSLIMKDTEEAWFELTYNNELIKINIKLIKDKNNPMQVASRFTPHDDYAVLELKNWDGQLGMSLQNPIAFWEADNYRLSLMVFGHKVVDTLKLDLQISVENQQ